MAVPAPALVADGAERVFFDNTKLLMAIAGTDRVIQVVNPAWIAAFGANPSATPGAALDRCLPDDLIQQIAAGAIQARSLFKRDLHFGPVRWLEADLAVSSDRILIVLVDVTDRVSQLHAIEEARQSRDLLLHDASVGTWRYDPVKDTYDFSPELHRLTALEPSIVNGRPLGRLPRAVLDGLCHPEDLTIERPLRERIVQEGGSGEFELRIRDPASNDWNHLKIMMRAGRQLSAGLHEVYGLTQRITELAWARDEAKAYAAKVKALVNTDVLTGLANRFAFEEQVAQAVTLNARGKAPFALLLIDLDRFKEVNDTLGHAAGDDLICEAAARLRTGRRPGDLVARLGGDEFVVLLHDVDVAGAGAAAHRIVADLSGTVALPVGAATLSCSVGVTWVREPGAALADISSQADVALYRAKHLGRGRYCFYEPEMDFAAKERKMLQSALRCSVADDEFEVAYQPIVSPEGDIQAVEALARWRHHERGLVSPAIFIPLAEETGLIGTLGEATLRRVCRDALDWADLRVGVNASAVELRQHGFCDRMERVFAEFGVDPARFDIELAESCLLQDDGRVHDALARIRALGCRLSLDNFGAGLSSLSALERYPIDVIKLDRVYASRLTEGSKNVAIVRALAQLSKALKVDVIAEGVETKEQLRILKTMRLTGFQGYLFSAALPKSELQSWLVKNTFSATP